MSRLATTLEDVVGFIRRYVVVTDHQAVAIALWVIHTYALDEFDTVPYLAITSPEKRSGKSRLLDVLEELVQRPWRVVLPSEAVTFRKIERDCPTLLLDETDAIFRDKSGQHEGLRALLNAGFRRYGSQVPRCVGPSLSVQEFSTFCAKALAGIGMLPDTVADRSILIRMERKRPTDHVHRFRGREVQPIGEAMRTAIAEAVSLVAPELAAARPELLDELDDRAMDTWEALLAIGDVAGSDWAAHARAAAVALSAARDEDEAGMGHRLLIDTRAVFVADVDRLRTADLIEVLADIETSPWGDWFGKPITPEKLSRLLKPYGIKPRHSGAFRGYLRADFEDAWNRYTPGSDTSTRPTRPTPPPEPKTAYSNPSSTETLGRVENSQNPHNQADWTGWTGSNDADGVRRLTDEEEAEYERLLAKYPDLAEGGAR